MTDVKARLQKLYKQSATSKAIFNTLGHRNRDRKNALYLRPSRTFYKTVVETGTRINDTEFENTFIELERIGLGLCIRNRNENVIKFKWGKVEGKVLSARSVGLIAMGKEDAIAPMTEAPEPQFKPVGAASDKHLPLTFRAQSGRVYSITLPDDIERTDLIDLMKRLN